MGLALIVLDKDIVQTVLLEVVFVVSLHEETSAISEDLRLDDIDTFDFSFIECHCFLAFQRFDSAFSNIEKMLSIFIFLHRLTGFSKFV